MLPFKDAQKTKCDVWHTERVYYPLITIAKFRTSVSPKEMDLVSFTILPSHTIIISYMSLPTSARKHIQEGIKYLHMSLRNAVQAHTTDCQHAKPRVKHWLKLGELN